MGEKDRKKRGGGPHRKGAKKKPAGWFLGPHHIWPTSRGGTDASSNMYPDERWNLYSEKHEAWHILFANMTPEEAVGAIQPYVQKDGQISPGFFGLTFEVGDCIAERTWRQAVWVRKLGRKSLKKEKTWIFFFGDLDGKNAVEWIEREFIRKEWLRPGV